MIDKLYLVSTRCVIIYYAHKPPVRVTSDKDDALLLANYLLDPRPVRLNFSDYKAATFSESEDTAIIEVGAA